MKRLLRKLTAVALCAALVGGTALTLPAVIPDSGIVASALEENEFLYTVNEDDTATVHGINKNSNKINIVIPSSIGGRTVTNISKGRKFGILYEGFSYVGNGGSRVANTKIVSVTIPDTVKIIGGDSFNSCSSIMKLNIGNGVLTIGESSFQGCSSLANLNIGNNVTTIEKNAFRSCNSLKTATIPDSLTTLDECAFADCTSLETVSIGSGLNDLDLSAFQNCHSLTSVNISAENTEYSSANGVLFDKDQTILFYYPIAKSDKEYTIPDGTVMIYPNAFWSGSYNGAVSSVPLYEANLESVICPDSLQTIGNNAFKSLISLKSVKLNKNIKTINAGAFEDCTALTDVYYDGSKTDWENIKIEYPNKVLKNATIHFNCDASGHDYTTEVIASTCTEQGYTIYTCTNCGDSYIDNYTDPTGHNYELVSEKQPTCTENGEKVYKCSNCGDSKKEEIAATGHDYKTEVVAPTCTEQGYTVYTCTTCDDSYVDNYTDATGHDYKVTLVDPTCTEQGYTIHTCANCGDSYKDNYTNATGHNYKTEVVAPTCTEEGYTVHTCTLCGDTYTDNHTDLIGHKYELIDEAAPTCTTSGSKTYKCSHCGDTVTETLKPTGHDYADVVIDPTCTERGFTLHICVNCKDKHIDSYQNALGHNYEMISEILPSCTEAGKLTYKCSVCGDIKTEITNATGHDYELISEKLPSCTEDGELTYKCSHCGDTKTETTNATGHDYELISEKLPTCTEDGELTYKCSHCGDTKTEIVKPTEHRYVDITIDPTCSNRGFTVHICLNCMDRYVDSFKAPIDHQYRSELIPPTCTEQGYALHTCTKCGDSYKDDFTDPLGHSYVDTVVEPTPSSKGYTHHECSVCGDSYDDTYTEYAQLDNFSTISRNTVPQNTSVFVKASAVGGDGNYKYAFYYKKSTSVTWATIGELYGKTTEVSFVPAAVAKYLVKVNVKDGSGKVVTKIFEVDSTKPAGNDLMNKSTLDKTTVEKGNPIVITGKAVGGSGDYKYAFYYKKTTSKAFTAIGTEYGDAATATFTPGSAADYNVRINVMDSSGTIVTKQYKITSK